MQLRLVDFLEDAPIVVNGRFAGTKKSPEPFEAPPAVPGETVNDAAY